MEKTSLSRKAGSILKEIRERHGISQQTMGEQYLGGYNLSQIQRLEKKARIDEVFMYCDVFHMEPLEVFAQLEYESCVNRRVFES